MKIYIISLFPEMFENYLNSSMLFKAQKIKAVSFEYVNLRDFGIGPRKTVDDKPYGGGDGMLLMIEPLHKAISKAKTKSPNAKVVLFTPKGKNYLQSDAKELSTQKNDLILICPRYEGYDERVTNWVDLSYSIGNYILTGGELPAMVLIDSVVRLLPSVLGGETSKEIESFYDDDQTVEFPQYTRPEVYKNLSVPEILLSGNHNEINKWRESKKHKQ